MYPHIKFIFLPLNTTPLLQPMDLGIVAIFKAQYLKRSMEQLVRETSNDGNIKSYRKTYNIMDAVHFISDAWESVPRSAMNGVWKQFWRAGASPKVEQCEMVRRCIQPRNREAVSTSWVGKCYN